ncbi:MAG: GGDEF domain-containing protein, partial [Armatimonadetes bacterium]|nr:GGDEF domain-containing protein [Armatimonadota bacterium]
FEARIGVTPSPGPDPLEVIAALAARAAQASELLVRLREREKELERLATTDELTGLYNRRIFFERLVAEMDRHLRYGRPLALLVIDLDNFKQINDTYGHQVGDQVLAALGQVLREYVRTTDTVARYGGEEFAVLVPETHLEGAAVAAERLRQCVQAATLAPVPMTVSIGVAAVPPCLPDPDALMAAADAALYQAKRTGKNRVAVSQAATKSNSSLPPSAPSP